MTAHPFKIGDRVRKRAGHEYPGYIASVFTTRAGAVRYVVEPIIRRSLACCIYSTENS